MSIERTRQRLLLLAAAFLLFITFTDAFKCPEHCSCLEIQRPRHSYNQATCTSLDGLRQLGKTSDIHSLDLSNMNLTKITNQLDKLTNLTRIDLHNNRLSEVNNLSAKRVRILNLSNNRITSGKLTKIPISVKHLNLTHNDITYLPVDFKKLIHLKSLELSDNPLNCTCETLEVRNWLQERNVWTDKPILCMAPLEIKGRPWLQIRQSDVCDANGLDEPRTLPFVVHDDENELMTGDDPNAYTGDASVEDKNDELGGEFMPVIDKRAKRTDAAHPAAGPEIGNDPNEEVELEDISDDDDEDGSGATVQDDEPSTIVPNGDEVYEGSGDDGAHVRLFHQSDETETTTAANETTVADESSTDATILPIEAESENVEHSTANETTVTEESSTDETILPIEAESENVEHSTEPEREETTAPALLPVVEEELVKVDAPKVDTEYVHPDVIVDEPAVKTEAVLPADSGVADNSSLSSSAPIRSESNEHNEAGVGDTSAAYILLVILGVLLVLLVLFVATKRSRTVAKNRRDDDIEHVAQEMADMDKNNLGKPMAEFIPLIPGRYPVDKENNLCNAQEPLLKKLTESDADSNPSANGTPTINEEPKTEKETKQQNGNVNGIATSPSTPIQNGFHKGDGHNFQPISPKPSRYSPVSLDVHSNVVDHCFASR